MLGIYVDSELSFKRHIDNICREVEYNLIGFRRVSRLADQKARAMLGQGVLISRITYGLQAVAGTTHQQQSRLAVLYNRCVYAISGTSKRERISLKEQRKEVGLLSFENLVKYFDVTTLFKIVKTKNPKSLSQYIVRSKRESRTQNQGKFLVNFTPKTEKLNKTFLFRAVKTLNELPRAIRNNLLTMKSKVFNARVKDHLLEK